MRRMPWGWQMLVNIDGANSNVLSEISIRKFNEVVCEAIGMVRHGEPSLTYFEDLDEKNGWTLVQLITTSSLVVHFCDNGKIFMDLFSCKPFDEQIVIDCLHKFFEPRVLEYDCIERDI